MGVQDTSKYMLLRSSAWANLTVRDTDERQDSGAYRCTTANMVGGTEINVTLVVKSKSHVCDRFSFTYLGGFIRLKYLYFTQDQYVNIQLKATLN